MSPLLKILTVLVLAATVRGQTAPLIRYTVAAPSDLAAGARPAFDDLRHDLARLTGAPVATGVLPAPGACVPGEVRVLMLGHEHDEGGRPHPTALARQQYTIQEQRCGSGRRVVLAGGSRLAGQWAVYDLLERLGVRYFHPESTYYPPAPAWPAQPLAVDTRPAFLERSMHVHRDHPVELSPPRDARGLPMADFQRRWIDWNVKLRQSAVDGFDTDLVGAYAYDRGFPREASLNLLNGQQGGRPILDPDGARPEAEQLRDAIEGALRPVPGFPPAESLTFQFNPSEFTEADHDRTVERLTFITRYMAEHHPGVALFTINHGTRQAPSGARKARFFDLSAFAPSGLGVMVHPLMFYDLERPVPGIYGNADFRGLLAFVREQARRRPIVHYPEGSWWLTFDLPVPLFLAPATLEAREHDLRLLAPALAREEGARKGVVGHHLFTSGQEWGYWLIDRCVAKMVWDLAFTHQDCLADFAAQFAGGDEIRAVLREVEARQVPDLRDPELVRFLVGSDDDIEAGAGVGLVFHPLPPAPAEVAGWDDGAVAALRARSLAPLGRMAAAYRGFARRIEALLPRQSEAQAPWVRELHDGLALFALRAEHAVAVYEGALAVRAAEKQGNEGLPEALARARALTAQARTIVRRREAEYRYPPALTIAGGERATPAALANRTVYPYRYLGRTHRLFYWTRPDEQLAALVRAASAARGDAPVADGRRVRFPTGSLHVEAPAEARRIEGLLPGLVATLGDDGAPFLELKPTEPAQSEALAADPWRGERRGGRAGPADLPLALRRLGELVVRDAVVEVADATPRPRLRINGHFRTADIIALMVKSGSFEASGARTVLALTLGYTPGRLPAALPVALSADGQAL